MKNFDEDYYYVVKTKTDNSEELIGFNLTEEEKDKLFYEFDIPSGGKKSSCDKTGEKNSYGSHKVKYKTKKKAITELITKPREFNNALKVINKHGFIVIPKNEIAVSYQNSFKGVF